MPETPEQYTQRILANLEGRRPIDILTATPRQIARLVKGVPRKKLARRPAPVELKRLERTERVHSASDHSVGKITDFDNIASLSPILPIRQGK